MGEATVDFSAAYDAVSSLRRTPNQRRSRERVAHILDCPTQLIAENGSERIRMSQLERIAAACDVGLKLHAEKKPSFNREVVLV